PIGSVVPAGAAPPAAGPVGPGVAPAPAPGVAGLAEATDPLGSGEPAETVGPVRPAQPPPARSESA
ncbi:ABC transporter ATP-binding protein, partial [Streptomyces niveus]